MDVTQYAGNVLVYGAMSPCDGDWFGGVNSASAEEFLHAVVSAEVCALFTKPDESCTSPSRLRQTLTKTTIRLLLSAEPCEPLPELRTWP